MQQPLFPRIVLASGSPRRRELLAGLGLTFDIVVSHVDEAVTDYANPGQYVEILAERKARAVVKELDTSTPTLVIGSDTVVVMDGAILGKPASEADAVAKLTDLQGETHSVFTGLCVFDIHRGKAKVGHSTTSVHMRPLTKEQIIRYVQSGEPMDKAGAYAIQGLGAAIVTGIEGDYFTVVGLPLSLLYDFLAELGYPVL